MGKMGLTLSLDTRSIEGGREGGDVRLNCQMLLLAGAALLATLFYSQKVEFRSVRLILRPGV